jgi:ubiquinone/menaquinone biosynthesis C-methylase UbiE
VAENGETELDRVTALWDKTAQDRAVNPLQGWLDSPIVLENYVRPRVSGSPYVNWLVGLIERLRIPNTARWLSLGCGAAGTEIFIAKLGLVSSLVALDSSPASLEQARQAAEAEGVTSVEFGQADLNRLQPPKAGYDVVLMNMSLHHVKEIRALLSRVRRALRPGGLLLLNEFIGPRQFQFTDLQVSLVEKLLAALPSFWRMDSATGEIKSEYRRMPVEHWNIADPSEAIRSDLIVSEVSRQFQIVERVDYGGTILNLLLEHIVHNFDPADEKDVAVIRLLGTIEGILLEGGMIPSDFTVIAARKRSAMPAFLRKTSPR